LLKVTSPYEGTTLIDYFIGDYAKIIDTKTKILIKGREVTLNTLVLDWGSIKRIEEKEASIKSNVIELSGITELLLHEFKDGFIIGHNSEALYLFLKKSIIKTQTISNVKKVLEEVLPADVGIQIYIVPDQTFSELYHPLGHHKGHKIIIEESFLKKTIEKSIKI